MSRYERDVWQQWLDVELTTYSDPKFDHLRPEHDERLRDGGTGSDSFWFNEVMHYPHRASVLGLDTPLGRQALIKGLAAYAGLVESMIRVYGMPPAPGVPSGELL